VNLDLPEQTQYIVFTVSLPCHQTSPLREFCKMRGTLLGGKDNLMWKD
jgi:hypothetical protein